MILGAFSPRLVLMSASVRFILSKISPIVVPKLALAGEMTESVQLNATVKILSPAAVALLSSEAVSGEDSDSGSSDASEEPLSVVLSLDLVTDASTDEPELSVDVFPLLQETSSMDVNNTVIAIIVDIIRFICITPLPNMSQYILYTKSTSLSLFVKNFKLRASKNKKPVVIIQK